MKTFKEKKSAEQIYEGIKLAHKINGHCSICYPCLEKIKAEATKAERERNMNIVLQFQGQVESDMMSGDIKTGLIGSCIELRKRIK